MLINTDGKRKHWGNANITFKCILHESHVQLRKSKKREPRATNATPSGRISFSTRFNKIRIVKLKENQG